MITHFDLLYVNDKDGIRLRSYHTVEVYEDGKWSPQFGDYSFRVARDEEKHLKDSFNLDGTKAKTRIVSTLEEK